MDRGAGRVRALRVLSGGFNARATLSQVAPAASPQSTDTTTPGWCSDSNSGDCPFHGHFRDGLEPDSQSLYLISCAEAEVLGCWAASLPNVQYRISLATTQDEDMQLQSALGHPEKRDRFDNQRCRNRCGGAGHAKARD